MGLKSLKKIVKSSNRCITDQQGLKIHLQVTNFEWCYSLDPQVRLYYRIVLNRSKQLLSLTYLVPGGLWFFLKVCRQKFVKSYLEINFNKTYSVNWNSSLLSLFYSWMKTTKIWKFVLNFFLKLHHTQCNILLHVSSLIRVFKHGVFLEFLTITIDVFDWLQ